MYWKNYVEGGGEVARGVWRALVIMGLICLTALGMCPITRDVVCHVVSHHA